MIGEQSTYIELLQIHINKELLPVNATSSFYLCNTGNVTYQSNDYVMYPFKLTGLEQVSTGALPRPKLDISSVDKVFSRLSFTYFDIIGAKVVYIRTFEEYLASGVGSIPTNMEIYRKESHNKTGIKFELRFPSDREQDFLPKKQMLHSEFPGMGLNKRATI